MKSLGAFLMTMGLLGFVLPFIGIQFRLINLIGDRPEIKIGMIILGAVCFIIGIVVDATRKPAQPAIYPAPAGPPPVPNMGGYVQPPHVGPAPDQFMINCPRCNLVNSRAARFCARCGMGFNPSVPPAPPRPVRSGGAGWIVLLLAIVGGIGFFILYRNGSLQRFGIGTKSATITNPSKFAPPINPSNAGTNTNTRTNPGNDQTNTITRTLPRPTDPKPEIKRIEPRPNLNRANQIARAQQRLRTDPAGALEEYRALAAADANDVATRHARNRLEIVFGNPATASQDEFLLTGWNPKDAQAWLIFAQAQNWQGDPQAEQSFARAAQLDPGLATRVFNEGKALYESGSYPLANLNFVSVAWLDRGNVETYFYMARARQGMNLTQFAAQSFQDFLTKAPNHPWAPTARQELAKLQGKH